MLEQLTQYKYPGSWITEDGKCEEQVWQKIHYGSIKKSWQAMSIQLQYTLIKVGLWTITWHIASNSGVTTDWWNFLDRHRQYFNSSTLTNKRKEFWCLYNCLKQKLNSRLSENNLVRWDPNLDCNGHLWEDKAVLSVSDIKHWRAYITYQPSDTQEDC